MSCSVKKYERHKMDYKIQSTEDLIILAYKEENSEEYWDIIVELHLRGTQHEFDLAKELTNSIEPIFRKIGADILGQLDITRKNFQNESVDILIHLLTDPIEDVIKSTAIALGHRRSYIAIPSLMALVNHPNAEIRYSVAFGLSCLQNIDAIQGLITLSRDQDDDTRNWATFGLGNQCEMDLPEIRKALHDRITDPVPEIRGEALIGLAERNDHSIIEAVKLELVGEFHGSWAIQAANLLASPQLCIPLQNLRSKISTSPDSYFISEIDEAIISCCKFDLEK